MHEAHRWKRNLAVVWFAQFISIMGFSFAMPFVPFYMQELGVTDPVKLKLWISLFSAATPLTIAIFAPIWGALGDRHGRKLMLIRANFAACVVLGLMGTVKTVPSLVVLRLAQGAMTGTIAAAQALVVGSGPSGRSGLALGSLSSAVFSGSLAGAALGGVFADWFGHRMAFFASAALLAAAGSFVLLGVRESRALPSELPDGASRPRLVDLRHVGRAWPFLLLVAGISAARQFSLPFLPLLVQEIRGTAEGAATWTGLLTAAGGSAGLLSGFLVGPLADRYPPPRVAGAAALASGVLMAPQAAVGGFLALLGLRFGMTLFAGGVEPAAHAWLCNRTAPADRGAVMGWSATARAVGWMACALAGGVVAAALGTRVVFALNGAMFLLLFPLIRWVERRTR
jgi:DHA1 family multidrug resistance protein-like MFS transporter